LYRRLGEEAVAQVPTGRWSEIMGPEENSIAIVMKHIAGNLHSRWREFLTTDGEKPDRERDAEFDWSAADSPETIRARWDEGWTLLFAAVEPLEEADLARTVTIRGEAHSVLQAVNRQQTHYAYHVGQIVLLARHFAGPNWRSLSIPRGKSKEYEVSVRGETMRPPAGK
jgi:hypothetical protein